jgi:hypothetical protein
MVAFLFEISSKNRCRQFVGWINFLCFFSPSFGQVVEKIDLKNQVSH